jgi:hypothetical protein
MDTRYAYIKELKRLKMFTNLNGFNYKDTFLYNAANADSWQQWGTSSKNLFSFS